MNHFSTKIKKATKKFPRSHISSYKLRIFFMRVLRSYFQTLWACCKSFIFLPQFLAIGLQSRLVDLLESPPALCSAPKGFFPIPPPTEDLQKRNKIREISEWNIKDKGHKITKHLPGYVASDDATSLLWFTIRRSRDNRRKSKDLWLNNYINNKEKGYIKTSSNSSKYQRNITQNRS